MTRMTINRWSLGAALCAIVLVAGCDTTGQRAQAKKATKAVTSLYETRAELARADQQVDATLAALDRLAATPDPLQPAYRVYTTQVSETIKQGREAKEQADQMRENWRDYMTAWEQEVDIVTSPELQANVVERRQAMRDNYDRLRDAARAWSAAYDPFIESLRDVQSTLSFDLTPAGVEAAQPAIEAARQNAQNLKQQISAFTSEINQVAAATPTLPVAAR